MEIHLGLLSILLLILAGVGFIVAIFFIWRTHYYLKKIERIQKRNYRN